MVKSTERQSGHGGEEMTAEISGAGASKAAVSAGPDKPEKVVPIGGAYAKYALVVLLAVYVFNFVDRQILSILAENIKADLGISDAEIGFLYGTSFAVFYAVFGIPLGRLADLWTRKNLISIGLAFWSVMTALSGTARGFASLAVLRTGVGVGEASASPASYSLLSDYFPSKRRATALGIYSSGVHIGGGIGVFLGGAILDTWNGWFPDPSLAPFGLKGWQAAFMMVGLPGLLMALWVFSLREPRRGQGDGLVSPRHPHPFREAASEFLAILPGLNFIQLARIGAPTRLYLINVAAAVVLAVGAEVLISATGSTLQWAGLAVGLYCAFSWGLSLSVKDSETFATILRCRTILLACVGFATLAFVAYGISFWMPPYFIRAYGVSATEVGAILGIEAAIGGWLGVSVAGFIADRWRQRSVCGNLYLGLVAIVLTASSATAVLLVNDLLVAYVVAFVSSTVSAMWLGPAIATVTGLVPPKMRALAGALFIMTLTFIGLALGPYLMGYISDVFIAGGASPSDGLRQGMIAGLSILIIGAACLLTAMRTIEQDEATCLARAQAAAKA
jgi:MFS family permease